MIDATLIYNPKAGPVQLTRSLKNVVEFWRELGWSVSIKHTKYAGHATELAQAAALAGHSLVFAAGGDGTIREVAQGLAHTESILAPVPCGMGNTLAKELNLPRASPRHQNGFLPISKALVSGKVATIDLGRCLDNSSWLIASGTGMDGFVVDMIEPRNPRFKLTRRISKFIYTIRSLNAGRRFPGMKAQIEIDGQHYSGNFLMVSVNNTRHYASGFKFNPEAVLDDDQLEVWMFRGTGILSALNYVLRIITLYRYPDGENIIRVPGRTVHIEADPPMPYQSDGDPSGITPFSVELQHQALRILVPATTNPELFQSRCVPFDAKR